MKPMKYKNDLQMWHKFAEFADHLKFVAKAQEQTLYSECVHYHWDNDAFEEDCNNGNIVRKEDFDAQAECWNCPFYFTQKAKL